MIVYLVQLLVIGYCLQASVGDWTPLAVVSSKAAGDKTLYYHVLLTLNCYESRLVSLCCSCRLYGGEMAMSGFVLAAAFYGVFTVNRWTFSIFLFLQASATAYFDWFVL